MSVLPVGMQDYCSQTSTTGNGRQLDIVQLECRLLDIEITKIRLDL